MNPSPAVDPPVICAWARAKAAIGTLAVVITIYACGLAIPTGWPTYLLSLPPLGIILLTAIARLNDVSSEKMSFRWNLRRLGLVLCVAGSIATAVGPLITIIEMPSIRQLILMYGFACTWLTTPYLPPWPYYISHYSKPEPHPTRRKTDGSADVP